MFTLRKGSLDLDGLHLMAHIAWSACWIIRRSDNECEVKKASATLFRMLNIENPVLAEIVYDGYAKAQARMHSFKFNTEQRPKLIGIDYGKGTSYSVFTEIASISHACYSDLEKYAELEDKPPDGAA